MDDRGPDSFLREGLAFDRLLADLSARFVSLAPFEVDQEIEQGADRPAAEQADDLRVASERFAADAAPLGTEEWVADERVTARAGRTLAARDLPWVRLREVVVHHLDLDAGFGYDALPPDLQRDLLLDQAGRLGAAVSAISPDPRSASP